MYPVSDAWVKAHSGFLAPEGFVRLSCYIPELQETRVYTKNDLLSFTHQQTASPISGELPKNHIEFSLDNSDGKWNPSNPVGLERYLSERLKITLEYGFDIDGVVEWIPGGVFYLSEWRTSPNGLEASFVARDLLEYMMDKPFVPNQHEFLSEVAQKAIADAELPDGAVVEIADVLQQYQIDPLRQYSGEETVAEVLQKCANATGCVMYQDRLGVLRIERPNYESRGYVIPIALSYSYPEIDFMRPMKNVSVKYENNQSVLYQIGSSGETQTINNDFITEEFQAYEVAEWVYDSLRTRKQISGSFRGDPRLDVLDIVDVESKYGTIASVMLTDVKYTFTGAFRATYSGYIRGSGTSVFMFCNEIYTGEVV